MHQLYVNAREEAAFGGGFAGVPAMNLGTRAMDEGGVQTAEVTPNGDMFAKNWLIAAVVVFLFMYTVSRILD